MQNACSGFSLPPGVSFCLADNRIIFLDQIADRYLALAPDQDRAFRSVAANTAITAGERLQMDGLIDEGLLKISVGGNPPRSCVHRVPTRAITSSTPPAVSALAQLRFAWHVHLARRRLKRHGLYKALQALHRLRASRNSFLHDPAPALRNAANLLAVIGRYMTRLDQCLPVSVGLAHYLLRQGVECEVILGVRLGPFQAHCWVQYRDRLLGDDVDVVRTFTPILVA